VSSRLVTLGAWLFAPLAIVAVTVAVTSGANAVPAPVPGSQGTDTSLPPTDSQVTVSGRGPFASLAVTVNQTAKLTNQAVSITWTGGKPTTSAVGRFTTDFMQIMQCWGDDDGSHPDNPGPPPEQCEQGAAGGTDNGLPPSLFGEPVTISRTISRSNWPNFDPTVGVLDSGGVNVWLPFRSVGGTVVDVQVDPNFNPFAGGNYWLNPYYNATTTNEIAGAVTGPDGRGAELFQVLTGNESSGLGCGRSVQPIPGGTKTPQCWIVIVPRGDQAMENVGTPALAFGDRVPVSTSPVSPTAWANRIAIPIAFNPVDSPCTFAEVERRIAGNELAVPAVASWQPSLCGGGALPPFSYAPVADGSARSLLASAAPGGPGMVVVSRPLPSASVAAANPVVYAPLSVSGLVIGFNVERKADIGASDATKQLEGVRVAELNLTPRLVAKLLTQSYTNQVSIVVRPPYPWLSTNPANLSLDPDFRQFNAEFSLLYISNGRTFSGLQLPAGNSDAALQIWEWVFADPEARAWLNGEPDPWGMKVNPAYAAVATLNPSGFAFGDPLPTSFPKADPFCYQAPSQGAGDSIVPPLLCGTDWMPYSRGFSDAATIARTASDGARIVVNLLAESPSQVWNRVGPQFIGDRAMLALTDTPSAVQFGLQVARLSRAGDDGPDRNFTAPDGPGLTAGVASMASRDVPTVLEPNPTASSPGAYPLTAITYAAITSLKLDAQARSDYAAFLDYAAGPGQVPGLDLGQLPRGYVPMSDSLRTQTIEAANQVRTLVAPAEVVPTTTTVASEVPAPASHQDPQETQQPVPQASAPKAKTVKKAQSPTTATVESPTSTTPPDSAPETTAPAAVEPTTTAPAVVNDAEPTSTNPTVATPSVEIASSRFAVPGLGIMALGSALGALEITKRPRRRRSNVFDDAEFGATGTDPS